MSGTVPTPLSELVGRPALDVAPALLGALITSTTPDGVVTARLTEVEAYGGVGTDPGSHAHRGRTARNATMFGPPGHWYVYFTYGMHWCLNLVCEPEGVAGAVLLRAAEVTEGADLAARRRRTRPDAPAPRARDLARGPARLTRALGVDGSYDGTSAVVADGPLVLRLAEHAQPGRVRVARGPRVGVGGAGAGTPWRFWLVGDPTVSAYRAHTARARAGAPGPSPVGSRVGENESAAGTAGPADPP